MTLGLANRVFPAGDLITETRSYLKALAETASPTSLMQMKQQAYRLRVALKPALSSPFTDGCCRPPAGVFMACCRGHILSGHLISWLERRGGGH